MRSTQQRERERLGAHAEHHSHIFMATAFIGYEKLFAFLESSREVARHP